MILEKRFVLNPRERRTLYFAYGYLPKGFDLDSLIRKYERGLESLWKVSSSEWKKTG